MDESLFESNKLKLVEAMSTTMGPGSGPDTADSDEEIQHTSDQSSKVGWQANYLWLLVTPN